MNEDQELDFLWQLALPYGSTGWKTSDCPVVRTTTKKVRSALQTAKKSLEWKGIKHCELAIQAQATYRKKERAFGDKPPQPVGLSVWLNEERWTMMLEPEEKRETIVNKCHCGQDVHGPKYKECTYHLEHTKDGKMKSSSADLLRQYAKDNGIIGMSREQAREFLKQRGFIL